MKAAEIYSQPKRRTGLLPRRAAILAYLRHYQRCHGFTPSRAEIAAAVGLRSPSTVAFHLVKLQEAGYLHHEPGRYRACTLIEHSSGPVRTWDAVRCGEHVRVTLPARALYLNEALALAEEILEIVHES
jgi:SOS-response transcriptional repressor LexA